MEDGRPLEVQIRTEDMDRTAREGIAAHWKYKDSPGGSDPTSEKQLTWLKQMYEWLEDAQAPDGLFDSLRRDISTHAVFVNTPKGDVWEFPAGATPLDFAYRVHSDVGHHCIGARVNDSMVPLRYHLQTGDVVEVLTSKNQTPHIDWLDIVVTGRARTRIRQRLRELKHLPPVDEAATNGTARPPVKKASPPPAPAAKIKEVDDATREKLIRVEGQKGMVVRFANCCKPMPGHAVIGYITTRNGITIHRADCPHLARKTENSSARMVGASWEGDEAVEAAMQVTIGARPNVLADITGAMRPMNIEISYAEYRPGDAGDSVFIFVFTAPDEPTIDRVKRTLETVSGVIHVSLIPGVTPRKVAQIS
jgi:GTP pyrophosphokinase